MGLSAYPYVQKLESREIIIDLSHLQREEGGALGVGSRELGTSDSRENKGGM